MFGKVEELVVVLVIVLVLFGGKQVPKLARAIGESIREVRGSLKGDAKEAEKTNEAS
jgi:sec-independent protein translocase protein TatA